MADVLRIYSDGKQSPVYRHQLLLIAELRHTFQQPERTVQPMSLCVVRRQTVVVRTAVEIAVERKTVIR